MIQSAEDVFAATENGEVPNLLYLEGHGKSGSRMWNHNQKQKSNTQSKDLKRPIFSSPWSQIHQLPTITN